MVISTEEMLLYIDKIKKLVPKEEALTYEQTLCMEGIKAVNVLLNKRHTNDVAIKRAKMLGLFEQINLFYQEEFEGFVEKKEFKLL